MKRVQPTDVAYLDAERPGTPPLMAALLILDPSTASGSFVRHRDVLAYVERRLHLAPAMRRRLVPNPLGIDEPRMIDDQNFDLEFHIRHLALPKPRDRRQLNILIARLMSRPIDMNRPLWEMYIIEGLEAFPEYPEDTFAILFKLHHAAFDGAAGLAAIFALLQEAPEHEHEPPEKEWTPSPTPTLSDWAVSSLREGVTQILANMHSVPSLVKSAYNGLATVQNSAFGAPRTRFQAPVSTHRVLDWINIPIKDMLELRSRLHKPKMNDMVLCIIAGALREYLGEKGELPDASLVALCPINVRGQGDPKDGGNQISAMRVPVGTDIADPIKRLAEIRKASAKGKEQAERIGPTFVADLLGFYPYYFRRQMTKQLLGLAERFENALPVANFVVSNIPPPKGSFYFAGSQALEFTGFGPLVNGIGLFHTISGMEGVMSIAVNSDREMMPDVTAYMECLRRSFADLDARSHELPPPEKIRRTRSDKISD